MVNGERLLRIAFSVPRLRKRLSQATTIFKAGRDEAGPLEAMRAQYLLPFDRDRLMLGIQRRHLSHQ
jgi:hypothetical protein